MSSLVVSLLLVVANVFGAGMIVPQVIRLHRVRSVDGVSGVWIGVGTAMNLWWLGYAIATNLWGALPVSAVGAALYAVMAWQYRGLLGPAAVRPLSTGFAAAALGPVPFLLLGGWSTAGVAIGLAYGIQFMPAAVSAIRSSSIAGISTVTWAMAWVEAVIWVIYGLPLADPALLIGGGGGTVAATIILCCAMVRRHRGRPPSRIGIGSSAWMNPVAGHRRDRALAGQHDGRVL